MANEYSRRELGRKMLGMTVTVTAVGSLGGCMGLGDGVSASASADTYVQNGWNIARGYLTVSNDNNVAVTAQADVTFKWESTNHSSTYTVSVEADDRTRTLIKDSHTKDTRFKSVSASARRV